MLNIMGPEDIKIISVSEVGLYFGFWNKRLDELAGKKVVVMNQKNHKVMGAFKLIAPPDPITGTCPTCEGVGKVEIKFRKR